MEPVTASDHTDSGESLLLSILRDQRGSLPLVLRALVISGLLVVLMANVVVPLLARRAERWLGG